MTDVSVVACESYDFATVRAAVLAAVEPLGGFGFLRPGTRVALKVNLVSGEAPDRAATTHPSVVCALCDILRERGCSVVVGDSPGGLYTAAAVGRIYRLTGMRECERYGARLNDDFSTATAEWQGAAVAGNFLYTAYLADADVIIDVCKLKTHGMMGLSAAAKNMFGAVPGTVKPEYHFRFPTYEKFADMIVDLDEYFHPVLSICDAVIGMEGNGPTAGTPRAIGAILASASPHKLDLAAAYLIGLDPHNVPTLMAAQARGLVPADVAELSVAGDLDAFRVPDYENVAVRHSLHFKGDSHRVIAGIFGSVVGKLLAARPTLDSARCVGCGKCADICPAHAITMRKGKARIRRGQCIRCFCCQEFCPRGAMRVHRTFVARLVSRGKKRTDAPAPKERADSAADTHSANGGQGACERHPENGKETKK